MCTDGIESAAVSLEVSRWSQEPQTRFGEKLFWEKEGREGEAAAKSGHGAFVGGALFDSLYSKVLYF